MNGTSRDGGEISVRPRPGDSDPFAVLKSRIGLGSELESLNPLLANAAQKLKPPEYPDAIDWRVPNGPDGRVQKITSLAQAGNDSNLGALVLVGSSYMVNKLRAADSSISIVNISQDQIPPTQDKRLIVIDESVISLKHVDLEGKIDPLLAEAASQRPLKIFVIVSTSSSVKVSDCSQIIPSPYLKVRQLQYAIVALGYRIFHISDQSKLKAVSKNFSRGHAAEGYSSARVSAELIDQLHLNKFSDRDKELLAQAVYGHLGDTKTAKTLEDICTFIYNDPDVCDSTRPLPKRLRAALARLTVSEDLCQTTKSFIQCRNSHQLVVPGLFPVTATGARSFRDEGSKGQSFIFISAQIGQNGYGEKSEIEGLWNKLKAVKAEQIDKTLSLLHQLALKTESKEAFFNLATQKIPFDWTNLTVACNAGAGVWSDRLKQNRGILIHLSSGEVVISPSGIGSLVVKSAPDYFDLETFKATLNNNSP